MWRHWLFQALWVLNYLGLRLCGVWDGSVLSALRVDHLLTSSHLVAAKGDPKPHSATSAIVESDSLTILVEKSYTVLSLLLNRLVEVEMQRQPEQD